MGTLLVHCLLYFLWAFYYCWLLVVVVHCWWGVGFLEGFFAGLFLLFIVVTSSMVNGGILLDFFDCVEFAGIVYLLLD